ncbi:MAG: hypothetical protein R6V85_04835 [Polyangia bacterium]
MAKSKKAAPEYRIEKKRNGRYAVIGKDGKYIRGEAKVEILAGKKLIKLPPKKKKAEKPEEEKTE